MQRRNWLKNILLGTAVLALPFRRRANSASLPSLFTEPEGPAARTYWVNMLAKIARPVLENLAGGTLRRHMPVEFGKGAKLEDRQHFTYLEAFGRLMAGMAPWLEGEGGGAAEQKLRTEFRTLYRKSIARAVDPASPDYLNFHQHGRQPLVDAAFLAHAFVRAPRQMWASLDKTLQARVIEELKRSRSILPYYSNWLLFSGMIEAFLLSIGEDWDRMRLDYAVRKHLEWYLGDSLYGDGPEFHWDYYNSYVIQPMLLDVLKILRDKEQPGGEQYDKVLNRARRYAEIQERLISPEGTFPIIGRSIVYRFGAFQHLAQIALWEQLPEELSPAQVRGALTAVLQKLMDAPGTFDQNGWLRLGLCGHQPGLAESYISTGSLYLCATGFLPLGLPPDAPFWSAPGEAWTSRKVYGGEDLPRDSALYERG